MNNFGIPLMLKRIFEVKQNLSPNFSKITASVLWLMADNVLRLGIGLLVGVWVARYLGPEQFGTLSYAGAFVGLFGVFARLGLDSVVIRDLVRKVESRDEILGTTFSLKLVSGAVCFLLTIISLSLLRSNDSDSLWIIGIIALIVTALNILLLVNSFTGK